MERRTETDGPRRREGAAVTWARTALPGLVLCLAVAAAAYALGGVLPGVSPLIIAIVLGIAAANTVGLPGWAGPGIDFSAKKLLRLGIVFLGLQLVLSDILALGVPMLAVVVCVVVIGILGTLAMARMLHVSPGLSLLVACGFSICGAAAVAAAAGVADPDDRAEEDTVTAVALVVVFGTLMIPAVPLAARLMGFDAETAGMWAGGSVHEVAQVVAVGGVLGGGALTVAVIVKLARVLLLAPVIAVLSVRQRRSMRLAASAAARDRDAAGPGAGADAAEAPRAKLPPIVPLFIVGFLAMVLLRSFVPLPGAALEVGSVLQTGLLAAAMFALGCGVKVRKLIRVGARPFVLATLATLLVAAVALVGVLLAR